MPAGLVTLRPAPAVCFGLVWATAWYETWCLTPGRNGSGPATCSARRKILQALAAAGGDPGLPADDGTTPLMAAVGVVLNEARQPTDEQSLELVTLLVGMDIDLNAVDRRGRTAMHGAARLAKNAIVEVLAENGARVDIADGRGLTPLDVGTVSRPLHPDTERLLRHLGATSINDGSR